MGGLHKWLGRARHRLGIAYHRAGADIGAIAHRNDLSEGRFDERVQYSEDWDLLQRLTANREPVMLPVVACYYSTDAPNRKSIGSPYAPSRRPGYS